MELPLADGSWIGLYWVMPSFLEKAIHSVIGLYRDEKGFILSLQFSPESEYSPEYSMDSAASSVNNCTGVSGLALLFLLPAPSQVFLRTLAAKLSADSSAAQEPFPELTEGRGGRGRGSGGGGGGFLRG